jgi:hypothetical protein
MLVCEGADVWMSLHDQVTGQPMRQAASVPCAMDATFAIQPKDAALWRQAPHPDNACGGAMVPGMTAAAAAAAAQQWHRRWRPRLDAHSSNAPQHALQLNIALCTPRCAYRPPHRPLYCHTWQSRMLIPLPHLSPSSTNKKAFNMKQLRPPHHWPTPLPAAVRLSNLVERPRHLAGLLAWPHEARGGIEARLRAEDRVGCTARNWCRGIRGNHQRVCRLRDVSVDVAAQVTAGPGRAGRHTQAAAKHRGVTMHAPCPRLAQLVGEKHFSPFPSLTPSLTPPADTEAPPRSSAATCQSERTSICRRHMK